VTADLDMTALAAEIDAINRKLGFRDREVTFDEAMELLVTETSEVTDAWRLNGFTDMTAHQRHEWQLPKPQGAGSEFADIAIRLIDDCTIFLADIPLLPEDMLPERLREKPSSLPAAMFQIVKTAVRASDRYEEGRMDAVRRELNTAWGQVCWYAELFGIDLNREILRKVAYNATRPHMHGGKRM